MISVVKTIYSRRTYTDVDSVIICDLSLQEFINVSKSNFTNETFTPVR